GPPPLKRAAPAAERSAESPPPLPKREPLPARKRFAAPPVPEATKERKELADQAMRLRSEQLRARIVYVDPEQETNAELDAITAQVVSELKALQAAAESRPPPSDAQQLEIELIRSLRELLEKMVSARRETFIRHKIEGIQRKIVGLYIESGIQPRDSQFFSSMFEHADDALLAVYRRHHAAIINDLDQLQVAGDEVLTRAKERLGRFHKSLAADVLARNKPELERLLAVYRDILVVFLLRDFRDALGEFAWEVVREARVAQGLDYKITESQFPQFREVFEAKFMDRLLGSIQQPLSERIGHDDGWRPETVRFAADPRIYAEICAVMCNAVYDYLHGEGFLDLPVDWQHAARPSDGA
ncbi:MAG: hypothetical protein AAF411_27630, partial [Myxococcota bacterium]